MREFTFDPASVGLTGSLEGLTVKNAAESLAIIRKALGGESGAAADVIALNAGAALYVAGVADTLENGIERAKSLLADGKALERLEAYANWSQDA